MRASSLTSPCRRASEPGTPPSPPTARRRSSATRRPGPAASLLLVALSLLAACGRPSATATPDAAPVAPVQSEDVLYTALVHTLESMQPEVDLVPAERKQALDRIAAYVRERRAAGEPVRLTFICTGNSRRSHLGQLWAAAVARHLGLEGIETYSGGTEPSALNPRTIAAIERAGFVVERPEAAGENPHYRVSFARDVPPIESFSKRFDDPVNPRADFVAVMTCSEADQECPLVPGAALRISLPYDDPKVADDTPEEAARYDERSRQIATEMLYLFSRARER